MRESDMIVRGSLKCFTSPRPHCFGLPGVYGRIDGDHIFQTALTTVAPNSKVGRVLHPNVSRPERHMIYSQYHRTRFLFQQKRILTVRECARAQGFPDKYEFHSVNTKLSDRVADVSCSHTSRSTLFVTSKHLAATSSDWERCSSPIGSCIGQGTWESVDALLGSARCKCFGEITQSGGVAIDNIQTLDSTTDSILLQKTAVVYRQTHRTR